MALGGAIVAPKPEPGGEATASVTSEPSAKTKIVPLGSAWLRAAIASCTVLLAFDPAHTVPKSTANSSAPAAVLMVTTSVPETLTKSASAVSGNSAARIAIRAHLSTRAFNKPCSIRGTPPRQVWRIGEGKTSGLLRMPTTSCGQVDSLLRAISRGLGWPPRAAAYHQP